MSNTTLIRFTTHAVQVTQDQDSGRVTCFKYNNHKCDIECFEDYDQAADYILDPLPIFHYAVVVQE